jgi:hypothetical protein
MWRVTRVDVTGDAEPEFLVEHCTFGCSAMRTTWLTVFRGTEAMNWEIGGPPMIDHPGANANR